jgi:hypothetical protein
MEVRAVNSQLYVVMRNEFPVAVEFELLPAFDRVPGIGLSTTNMRKRGNRVWVAEYRDSVPTDAEWSVHRVDVAPYLDSTELSAATEDAWTRGYQAARMEFDESGMP